MSRFVITTHVAVKHLVASGYVAGVVKGSRLVKRVPQNYVIYSLFCQRQVRGLTSISRFQRSCANEKIYSYKN
jgi:hypothetical protein